MIYLAHPDSRIEACESEPSAVACEARGFVRCTYERWHWLWECKDRRAQYARWLELRARLETAPLKAVSGWTHYGVDGKEIKQ